jgi:hypothetical protein
MTLLDLSAASDTVDHATMPRRWMSTYDLGGIVINWFRSHLSDRTQHVRHRTCHSKPAVVSSGVPQGSLDRSRSCIIRPTYRDLSQVNEHPHANDTQIYGSPRGPLLQQLATRVSSRINDVTPWVQLNRLQLGAAKTEVFWSTSAQRRHILPAV